MTHRSRLHAKAEGDTRRRRKETGGTQSTHEHEDTSRDHADTTNRTEERQTLGGLVGTDSSY